MMTIAVIEISIMIRPYSTRPWARCAWRNTHLIHRLIWLRIVSTPRRRPRLPDPCFAQARVEPGGDRAFTVR